MPTPVNPQQNNAVASTVTVSSYSVGAGSRQKGIAIVAWRDNAANSVSGVTWNGNAMTAMSTAVNSDNSGGVFAGIQGFWIDSPESGDVVANLTNANADGISLLAYYLNDAASGAPEAENAAADAATPHLITQAGVTVGSGVYYGLIEVKFTTPSTALAGSGATLIAEQIVDSTLEARSGVAWEEATSTSEQGGLTSDGSGNFFGLLVSFAIAEDSGAGGGSQEDVTAEFDFGSTLSGIASVNFPANAELTSSTFNVSGQAESQGSGQEDLEATLEADFDVIDGDSLNIYVAGFSTLSSGFQVEGTTANEDVENIDGTLTWSSQVNDLRVETLLENSGELSAGFQLENSSTILQLNASLNFQASLTGSTGLGKNPNEVIRTGTDFIDTGIDYVKNFDNQIVKTY